MKFIKSFIKNHSTQITSFALAMAVFKRNCRKRLINSVNSND